MHGEGIQQLIGKEHTAKTLRWKLVKVLQPLDFPGKNLQLGALPGLTLGGRLHDAVAQAPE